MLANRPMNITLIGAGRLSWSLIPALQQAGYPPQLLISRNPEQLAIYQNQYQLAQVSTQLSLIPTETELIFLCVGDKQIAPLAEQLRETQALLVHCSGTSSLSLLAGAKNTGVFYPLQTFTRDKVVRFSELSLFLEANHTDNLAKLQLIASAMSQQVYERNSEQRLKLHLGAVICSNFVNYLYQLSEELGRELHPQALQLYAPLIREQAEKALHFGAKQAQTGPALRGDLPTLEKHLNLLESHTQMQALYRLLSNMINPSLDL